MKSLVATLLLTTVGAAAAAPLAAGSQPTPRVPEPVVREHIIQDRSVRIDEVQVRGATTSIKVQPLHGGAAYTVQPPAASESNDPAHMQGRMQWTIGVFR